MQRGHRTSLPRQPTFLFCICDLFFSFDIFLFSLTFPNPYSKSIGTFFLPYIQMWTSCLAPGHGLLTRIRGRLAENTSGARAQNQAIFAPLIAQRKSDLRRAREKLTTGFTSEFGRSACLCLALFAIAVKKVALITKRPALHGRGAGSFSVCCRQQSGG